MFEDQKVRFCDYFYCQANFKASEKRIMLLERLVSYFLNGFDNLSKHHTLVSNYWVGCNGENVTIDASQWTDKKQINCKQYKCTKAKFVRSIQTYST